MSSKNSSLEEMAPSTRAAAASDLLLNIPMATIESRVSTTRLFILATTGMSRSPPSNPSAEMFFSTRSRKEVRFGFSSFSVTMINPSRIVHCPFIRLRIAYLPYTSFVSLYLRGRNSIARPSGKATLIRPQSEELPLRPRALPTSPIQQFPTYLMNWCFGLGRSILLSISSSGPLSVVSFEKDNLASRNKPTLEYVQSRR
jgi:hypothetical protein